MAATIVRLRHVALVICVGSRPHSSDRRPAQVEVMIGIGACRHVTDATRNELPVAEILVQCPALIGRLIVLAKLAACHVTGLALALVRRGRRPPFHEVATNRAHDAWHPHLLVAVGGIWRAAVALIGMLRQAIASRSSGRDPGPAVDKDRDT